MSSEDKRIGDNLGMSAIDNNLKDGQGLIDNSKNDDLNTPFVEKTDVELTKSELKMNDADVIKFDHSDEQNIGDNTPASIAKVVSENGDHSQNTVRSTNSVAQNSIESKQDSGEGHMKDLKCKDSVRLDENIPLMKLNESKLSVKHSLEDISVGNSCTTHEKDQNEIIDGEDSTADEMCGIWCFKPQYIQQYRRPKVFLILFSILGIIQGCYYPYFVSIFSTLEKRYSFTTKVSGALMLPEELTPLLFGIIAGYIGSRAHRPRMIALGMFMSAGCCFVSGLPYLIYGPVKHLSSIKYQNETGPEFCDAEFKSGQCDSDDQRPTMTVIGILAVGSFLKGFATISFQIMGLSYMDDIIKKKNSPLYFAIAFALRLLGPLIGYLMSSVFLKFSENPTDDPGYGPEDPRWIGAWWIGFFLQGFLLLIFTFPIGLFPRRLPGQRRIEKKSPGNTDGVKQVFLGLYSDLKKLGRNPVLMLITVNTIMKIFGHFGHSIMLPKYMENQFRLSAAAASLYSGAFSITFIMVSSLIGGCLIWKFQPRIKFLLAGMIASEITMCVGLLILMSPGCQPVSMVNFGTNDEGLVLNSTCNEMCDCTTTSYTPFCGPSGTIYFSPCYAGCTEKLISSTSDKSEEFGNCSCVDAPNGEHLIPTISEGVCPDENCWYQALIYLIIYFALISFSNLFQVAHSVILLRSVHPSDKSMALGIFETFTCLFGFIPFPVTFGALVDAACIVWEKNCGGETGNCWFYDMEKYSYLLHGVGALFCSLSSLCLIALYFLSSRIRDLYIEEGEEKNNVDEVKLDTASKSATKL